MENIAAIEIETRVLHSTYPISTHLEKIQGERERRYWSSTFRHLFKPKHKRRAGLDPCAPQYGGSH